MLSWLLNPRELTSQLTFQEKRTRMKVKMSHLNVSPSLHPLRRSRGSKKKFAQSARSELKLLALRFHKVMGRG